jgi:hypothetical protein
MLETKKMLQTYAKAVRQDNVIIGDARGKLVKV